MYESRLAKDADEKTIKQLDQLFEGILKLQTQEECYRFFEDICTVAEIRSLAQRLQVAKMLDENKIYTDIALEANASTATISRVKKCLNYGADGYKIILKRLKENEGE